MIIGVTEHSYQIITHDIPTSVSRNLDSKIYQYIYIYLIRQLEVHTIFMPIIDI